MASIVSGSPRNVRSKQGGQFRGGANITAIFVSCCFAAVLFDPVRTKNVSAYPFTTSLLRSTTFSENHATAKYE
ncbi:MAG: hypothetical protein L7F78_24965, partial [Syntrophales bacterium LBB04]|nr:hypothetical protein [Syntrophales bacterium LBB04]